VTLLGCRLSAQQARALEASEKIATVFFGLAFSQQGAESLLIGLPISIGPEGIHDCGCRGQAKVVFVLYSKSLAQQESQVVPFAITGELRSVAKPDIDHSIHTSLL
jgi:hypothetical protein